MKAGVVLVLCHSLISWCWVRGHFEQNKSARQKTLGLQTHLWTRKVNENLPADLRIFIAPNEVQNILNH